MKLSWSVVGVAAVLLLAPVFVVTLQARSIDDRGGQPQAQAPDPDIFREVIEVAETIEDAEERAYMLMQIASAQARTGNRLGARFTFEKAVEVASAVSVADSRYAHHILTWIARAQDNLGERDAALETLRKAVQIAQGGADAAHDLKKLGMLQDIFERQLRLNDRIAARSTYERADQLVQISRNEHAMMFGPDTVEIMRAMLDPDPPAVRRRKLVEALQAAEGIVDPINLAQELSRIASSWAQEGELDEALQIVTLIEDARRRVSTLISIAHILVDQGDLDEALRVVRMADVADVPVFLVPVLLFNKAGALQIIAEEQAKAGNRLMAREVFREAIAVAEQLQDPSYRLGKLPQIAEAQVRVGFFDDAIQTVDTDADSLADPWIWERIAQEQAKMGDREAARRTLQDALRIAQENLHKVSDDEDDTPHDEEAVREFRPKDSALRTLARIQAKLGDVNSALQTADAIENEQEKSHALSGIAQAQAAAGDAQNALEWARQLDNPIERRAVIQGIVAGIAARPSVAEAPDTNEEVPN